MHETVFVAHKKDAKMRGGKSLGVWGEGSFDGGAEGFPYKALETTSMNNHFH
jgi:hypothetical protein